MSLQRRLLLGAGLALIGAWSAQAQTVPTQTAPVQADTPAETAAPPPPTASAGIQASPGAATSLAPAVAEVTVTAQRLNAARAAIQPALGATTYTVTNATIQALPGGDNQQLNQVLLQLPSVSQDSFGQFHVRDDHNNLQYRINGIILPEGISVFGQTLTPRLIEKLDLITGALPAQYGLRTAGIIDVTTKSGLFDNGGSVGIYGGSRGEYEPSFEYGGHSGGTNFFVSGEYRRTQLGIESPDGRPTPDHDRADELNGFFYLDHILGQNDRVALVGGVSNERFQIPDNVGVQPSGGLVVNGQTAFPSTLINDDQRETTDYLVGSFLHDQGPITVQASLFARYSTLTFRPNAGVGDLLFTGISQYAAKKDLAVGTQIEGVYRLNPQHTIRSGLIVQGERATSVTDSQVLPFDGNGNQISDQPVPINDRSGQSQYEYSYYLQDEYRPLQDVTVNYGLRFDYYDGYRSTGQISPRLNIVYSPHSTTFHAGYARYFTPPPFELVGTETVSKFVGTSGASSITTDTTPYPERTDYYDVGVQQKIGRRFTIGLDGYLKRSHDLIDEGQFGAPIILTPFNYQEGKTRGVELTMNYAKGSFNVYGNLAYARGMGKRIVSSEFNFNGNNLNYIAGHYIYLDHDQTVTASAGTSYLVYGQLFSGDLLFGSGLRAGGDVPNGAALPDYYQFNVSTSRKFSIPYAGRFQARLDIINLTDEIYKIRDGTGIGVGAPQFGPRRAFFVGLTKYF